MPIKTKNILLFILIIISYGFSSVIPNSSKNDYSGKLLIFDFLPSPVALGGAGSCYINDGNSSQYNPAILAYQNNDNALTYEFASLPVDTSINYFSLLIKKTFFSWTSFNSEISEYSYDGLYEGTLNSAENIIGFGQAFDLDEFSFGFNFKYFYSGINSYYTHVLLLDIGFVFPIYGKMLLSVSLNNIGFDVQDLFGGISLNKNDNILNIDSSQLPMLLRGGFKFDIINNLILYSDIDYLINKYYNIKLGLEYNLFKILSLKIGYFIPDNGNNSFSTGFSYFIKDSAIVPFKIQYTIKFNNELGNIHYFGIIFY